MWRGCCGILVLVGVVMVQMIGMSRSMPHPQPQQHPTSLVKTCGSKLLEGIKTFCRNPDAFLAFHYSMQARSNLQQKRSSSSQYGLHNTPNLFSRVSDDPYEDDGGSEEEEDFADGEEGDEDEYERKGRSIETERKDIVQACCRNACSPQEFSRFCAMTDNGERSTITTRKPTTTTTLPPPSTTPQGVAFGRPSFPNSNRVNHKPHHRLVTDKPFAPSLGTNLGTRDEVLFNH